MLAEDRERAEALLKSKGEERMRYFDNKALKIRQSNNMFSTGGLVAYSMLPKMVTTTQSCVWRILRM